MADNSDDDKKWGALLPLAEEVSKKNIDGFEIPFELVNLKGYEWPHNGGPVAKYTTIHGFLLLREEAHENFGYYSPRDFASAAKRNLLRAKTVPGAISLGRTRSVAFKPIHIFLSINDLWSDLRFLAETSEEALQMRDFLRNIYPESKISISENAVKTILTNAFSFNILTAFTQFHTLLPRQKRAVWILLGTGLANVILAVITPLKLVPSGLDILAFVLLMITLFTLLPKLNPETREDDLSLPQ